ncbi:hypothetical protein [Halobaculum sp. MBLA0143]|uniref:hypothetical protein n=1 Tax=Halobaculum sp. MBLA0143 TaxID=3079933 RepID=UPI00352459F4
MARTGGIVAGVFDAVFRPARLVAAETGRGRSASGGQFRQLYTLSVVYLVNVVLYAAPLTLAGVGVRGAGAAPPAVARLPLASPDTVWQFTVGLIVNSLTLLAGTVLTLFAVHAALVVTLQSRGFVRTAYSVVYSTSAYLAGMYTVVVYLSQAGTDVAAGVVLDLQRALFASVLNAMGSTLEPPGGEPQGFVFSGMSTAGVYALSLLAVLAVYYLYSLYLGSRINHDAGRLPSLLVVLGVVVSPVVYIVATVLAQGVPFIPKL